MKKLLPIITLLLLVGCTTLWTGVVTLTQVHDTAMKNWAQAVKNGTSTTAINAAVVVADAKYRQAATVAADALTAYKNGGSSDAYVNALIAVRSALDSLITILTPAIPQADSQSLRANLAKATKL